MPASKPAPTTTATAETAETEWISLQQAADRMQCAVKTIRRRISDGTIRGVRFGPRLVRVDAASLNKAQRELQYVDPMDR